jgi:hypothetical protein
MDDPRLEEIATAVCDHGSLKRQCRICELEEELRSLREERDAALARVAGAFLAGAFARKLSAGWQFDPAPSVKVEERACEALDVYFEQVLGLRDDVLPQVISLKSRAESAEAELQRLREMLSAAHKVT